jgi:hypothetical protein
MIAFVFIIFFIIKTLFWLDMIFRDYEDVDDEDDEEDVDVGANAEDVECVSANAGDVGDNAEDVECANAEDVECVSAVVCTDAIGVGDTIPIASILLPDDVVFAYQLQNISFQEKSSEDQRKISEIKEVEDNKSQAIADSLKLKDLNAIISMLEEGNTTEVFLLISIIFFYIEENNIKEYKAHLAQLEDLKYYCMDTYKSYKGQIETQAYAKFKCCVCSHYEETGPQGGELCCYHCDRSEYPPTIMSI